MLNPPPEAVFARLVRAALLEDLGGGGDLTTDAIVAKDRVADARIVARRGGTIAGLFLAHYVFVQLDGAVRFEMERDDGSSVRAGDTVATVSGNARAVLSGERTALNFLGRLSGVASATRELVERITGTGARIVDTRKTTPGMRALEKYAVRCGGGQNHRFGLSDGILIKDNHLAVTGSIADAVQAVRSSLGHLLKIEVEVDSIEQLRDVLHLPIDAVLLDNMPPERLREAVAIVNGRMLTEASGGITPQTVLDVAQSGVDLVSSGWITHSAPALDLSLELE